MKNKKIIIISIVIIIILILSLGTYYIFTKEDKDTTLNLLEKQWIENNKNKVIDMGIVNEIPVFNYNGEGLFFDFLNSLEKITNLEFNKISYTIDSKIESPYAFKIVDQVSENDILIYQDNYVLLTKNKVKYSSPNKISNLRIGVLKNDLSGVNTYLSDAINITFKPYENIDNLINYINISESDIDALVLPKNIYLNTILTNQLNIAYNITELTKNYVLSLGDTDRLNDIIIKYYKNGQKKIMKNHIISILQVLILKQIILMIRLRYNLEVKDIIMGMLKMHHMIFVLMMNYMVLIKPLFLHSHHLLILKLIIKNMIV